MWPASKRVQRRSSNLPDQQRGSATYLSYEEKFPTNPKIDRWRLVLIKRGAFSSFIAREGEEGGEPAASRSGHRELWAHLSTNDEPHLEEEEEKSSTWREEKP